MIMKRTWRKVTTTAIGSICATALLTQCAVLDTPPPESRTVVISTDNLTKASNQIVVAPSDVEEATNSVRVANGLPPLLVVESIRQSACSKADDMMDRNYWGHFAPDGSGGVEDTMHAAGIVDVPVGENNTFITKGPTDPVKNFWNSPGHRENMLSPDWTHFAMCKRTGEYQGNPNAELHVQQFARIKLQ